MASIQKPKPGQPWRAFVCKKNPAGETIRKSGTFESKRDAQDWAAEIETDIKAGVSRSVDKRTFGDLLKEYRDKVSVTKRGERWERFRIGAFLRDPVAEIPLTMLAAPDIAAWRDRRIKQVSAGTVRREWTLLSNACSVGIKEWHWLQSNPCIDVRRPAPPAARDRLFLCHEIDSLLVALGWYDGIQPDTVSAMVGHALLFCLETGMRCGEACNLVWQDITETVAVVRKGKTLAATRRVPLSPYARELLAAIRPNDVSEKKPVFGLSSAQVDVLFRKARGRCGIDDLHFHDSRATAITRLAKKLDILDLARMIGHANLGQLRVYYRETAEDIAAKL